MGNMPRRGDTKEKVSRMSLSVCKVVKLILGFIIQQVFITGQNIKY